MENKEHNGGPPCGQVRVLLLGDAGVGKTSLAHLILKGSSTARPVQTIGCTVDVKHTSCETFGSLSNISKGDSEREFLSNYGIYQDMNDVEIAGLCSILKLMKDEDKLAELG